jgi:hypothetical protein
MMDINIQVVDTVIFIQRGVWSDFGAKAHDPYLALILRYTFLYTKNYLFPHLSLVPGPNELLNPN